jgi:hypothetical protein
MSPIVHQMLHTIERVYPQTRGCSLFVFVLLLWSAASLLLYSFTKWTEWFVGFVGGALFALPFLLEFAK